MSSEPTVAQKNENYKEEKIQIARYAASLIEPQDFVYLDAGTTTGYMLDFIKEKTATFVTNAVSHAQRLSADGMRVLLIGGELKSSTEAVIGTTAVLTLQNYHFTKGFFGANGISRTAGFTTPDEREALVKQTAMKQCASAYVLCDHSKFNMVSSVTFASFSDAVILTNEKPDDFKDARDIIICNENSDVLSGGEEMKRILLMVIKNILLVPWMWIKLCYHAKHTDKYTEEEQYKMLRFITLHANKGGNVKIDVHGVENLPEENGFMFFPNHQGLYDVLAIIEACPRPFSVVAKKEIADIQFLKQVFACMKAYMIDREDVRQAMQVIVHVTEEVKKGRNYLIFAEGTRSKNGNQLREFKGGSFKSATKAKCPIVPVALIDSFKPFDTNTISPVTVQVHFLEPMYYEEYKDMKTTEIASIVKSRIEQVIRENAK